MDAYKTFSDAALLRNSQTERIDWSQRPPRYISQGDPISPKELNILNYDFHAFVNSWYLVFRPSLSQIGNLKFIASCLVLVDTLLILRLLNIFVQQ